MLIFFKILVVYGLMFTHETSFRKYHVKDIIIQYVVFNFNMG